MSERLNITVEDGVTDRLIELAGSNRKQGEFVSRLVNEVYNGRELMAADGLDVESLGLQVLGLAGRLKSVEGRVQRVETQLSALIARDAA